MGAAVLALDVCVCDRFCCKLPPILHDITTNFSTHSAKCYQWHMKVKKMNKKAAKLMVERYSNIGKKSSARSKKRRRIEQRRIE